MHANCLFFTLYALKLMVRGVLSDSGKRLKVVTEEIVMLRTSTEWLISENSDAADLSKLYMQRIRLGNWANTSLEFQRTREGTFRAQSSHINEQSWTCNTAARMNVWEFSPLNYKCKCKRRFIHTKLILVLYPIPVNSHCQMFD